MSTARVRGRRSVVTTARASIFALGVNLGVWLAAAKWNFGLATHPLRFYATQPNIALLRISLAADIAAYLLLVPLVLAVDLGPLARVGGLTYSLVGASGAAILVGTWPALLHRLHSQTAFTAVTEGVRAGLWNVVAVIGIGVWLASLSRSRSKLRSVGTAAAVAAFVDAAATVFGANAAAELALSVLVVLFVVCVVLTTSELRTVEGLRR
jgi:hypothetical protein